DPVEVTFGEDRVTLALGDHAPTFELARRVEGPNAAVELVGAGLGDRVDDAAGRPAVLRHVTTRLDPDLLEELDREGGAVETKAGVIHRQAVDIVLVLGRGGARDAGAEGVAAGARGGLGDRLERAVGGALAGRHGDRDPRGHLRVERAAGGR